MIFHDVTDVLASREADLSAWLGDNAPQCASEQTHLDAGTDQRAYWHFGYMMALRDVLALLSGSASTLKH